MRRLAKGSPDETGVQASLVETVTVNFKLVSVLVPIDYQAVISDTETVVRASP